jgi:predicted aspartyl protease
MGIVRTRVSLKGMRGTKDCIALVDTGAAMTVIDRSLAKEVGVTYTGRRRSLVSATGHKLEGEVAIVRELVVEDEVLDYEKVMVVELTGDVRKVLREIDVDDSVIVGLTTVGLAGLMPDTATGRLKKVETFLF